MSEAAHQTAALDRPEQGDSYLIVRIAWRNLWRNPRRTWLTAAGISFACLLVGASVSMQVGSYAGMVRSATGFLQGQIQIAAAGYVEDERIEQTLTGVTETLRHLRSQTPYAYAPRARGYALVSAGERSFGGLLTGVDFAQEQRVVTFFRNVQTGRLPAHSGEVLLGETMARNLGVNPGDEVVFLGTAKEGGVAALALVVAGIFSSGQAEIDRNLMFADLTAVQNAFALGDEVHQIVVHAGDPADTAQAVEVLQQYFESTVRVRGWWAVMPDVVQAIELDRISGWMVYGAIVLLVSFTVVNTFLMVVFERTREFGMLLCVGMRPGLITTQLMLEAFFMWGVGVAIGLASTLGLVGYFANVGIPIDGLEDLTTTFFLEDRIYPALSLEAVSAAPLILLVGTQLAALIGALRVRRLKPIQAQRQE